MKRRPVGVCLVAALLVGLASVLVFLASVYRDDRLTLGNVINRLGTGDISAGFKYDVVSMPAPSIEAECPPDVLGNVNRIRVYLARDRLLLLFTYDKTLYGACFVGLPRSTDGPGVRWYFCDTHLLSAHVECLLAGGGLRVPESSRVPSAAPDGTSTRRWTVGEVIERLDDGRISLGSAWPNTRMPKPWVAGYPSDASGKVNALNVHRENGRVLLLFSQQQPAFSAVQQRFYGACLLEPHSTTGSEVKWYFCDRELLEAHIECLLVDNDANADQRRRREPPTPEEGP